MVVNVWLWRLYALILFILLMLIGLEMFEVI
jgi:hypothetical protein